MTTQRNFIISALLAALSAFVASTPLARADIFEWEYIDPTDPSQGKQQSTMLAPDGEGVNAKPGADLSNRNLTKAYLAGVDLSPYLVYDDYYGYIGGYIRSNLTAVNLSLADLSNAKLNAATLTGANLSGADVRGANFDQFDQYGYSYVLGYGTGLTLPQLVSTASYAAHDLSGVSLGLHDLTGANFSGFNLTEARFAEANLTNVNFSNANLTGGMIGGTLTGTNLSGAIVRGAVLWGISKAQLYSTASYQSGDLSGITFYSGQTGWNFAGKNLSQATFWISVNLNNANFTGAILTDASLSHVTLKNSNFSQANLTDAVLDYANLAGANFTGATIRGANFSSDDVFYPGSGLSSVQLTATASYQAHDLAGIKLRGNNLSGVNLTDQNLTDADLSGAALESANLTGAEIRGASFQRDVSRNKGGISAAQLYSTASYEEHDLSGIGLESNDLAGVNFAGQNLTDALFLLANLTNADFQRANLTNARFSNLADPLDPSSRQGANLSGANLQQADLTNAVLGRSTLINANLSGAILKNTDLAGSYYISWGDPESGGGGYYPYAGSDLTAANLSHANLTNANFSTSAYYDFGPPPGAILTNANLTGADARGANFQYATMTGANTTNLIQPDGHVAGLDLTAGEFLVVRDYDGNPTASPPVGPLPIVVEEQMAMDASSTLRLVFDAEPWDSTLSFTPGIPVTLGGTLELTFAPEVNVATQVGRAIDLFDWTGVAPVGTFTVLSPHTWDLSQLYTTGEVTLAAAPILPGDFNHDGTVDAADYIFWRKYDGTPDGYDAWRAYFGAALDPGSGSEAAGSASASAAPNPAPGETGFRVPAAAVPEPASLGLFLLAVLGRLIVRRRR